MGGFKESWLESIYDISWEKILTEMRNSRTGRSMVAIVVCLETSQFSESQTNFVPVMQEFRGNIKKPWKLFESKDIMRWVTWISHFMVRDLIKSNSDGSRMYGEPDTGKPLLAPHHSQRQFHKKLVSI